MAGQFLQRADVRPAFQQMVMEWPYNRFAKDKLTLSFARLLCKAKTNANGTAESLPDLMQPVEMELDSHSIPL